MSGTALPDNLQNIIEMFASASKQDRISYLLEFAESLPDLPPDLYDARDRMEQVHECQSPVFLQSELDGERVRYYLDVPREAPTVRGFASLLHEGLDGATPEQIAATPLDLYERLGLNDVLSPLRLRGLTALLTYMKRNAARLATEQTQLAG